MGRRRPLQESKLDTMHAIYNSSGPGGFLEHGHPPCLQCLEYHDHLRGVRSDRNALLRRAYIELYARYAELGLHAPPPAVLRVKAEVGAVVAVETIRANVVARLPWCMCGPGEQCPAHRTHALLVEIYSLLEGGQETV